MTRKVETRNHSSRQCRHGRTHQALGEGADLRRLRKALLVFRSRSLRFAGPPVPRGGQLAASHLHCNLMRDPAPPLEVICSARPRFVHRRSTAPYQLLQQLPHDGPVHRCIGGVLGPSAEGRQQCPAMHPLLRPQQQPAPPQLIHRPDQPSFESSCTFCTKFQSIKELQIALSEMCHLIQTLQIVENRSLQFSCVLSLYVEFVVSPKKKSL